MKAIRRAHPNYESARVYAILSLNGTLQDVAAQLAEQLQPVRQRVDDPTGRLSASDTTAKATATAAG
jgi:hypothetical protein